MYIINIRGKLLKLIKNYLKPPNSFKENLSILLFNCFSSYFKIAKVLSNNFLKILPV